MQLEWQIAADEDGWDGMVARFGGHPLQTSLWGNARKDVDGIDQIRLKAHAGEHVVAVARVEVRRIPLLGNVAWVPRGPAISESADKCTIIRSMADALKAQRFVLCAAQPWSETATSETPRGITNAPRTIWIDLTIKKEKLWANLNQQWRYGVGRASREGVTVATTRNPNDVASFFQLCSQISETKGFQLPGSLRLIQRLLDQSSPTDAVEARLFVARHAGELGAGAVVMRSGANLHYLWGGVNRSLSRYRTGEAVQWAVIEWGLECGCRKYDLEGIDPKKNPGTYEFKKKMGGREVTLSGMEARALRWRGVPLKLLLTGF